MMEFANDKQIKYINIISSYLLEDFYQHTVMNLYE